jgi:membrane-associated protease RseP (regulator of RpoE activity)
MLLLPLVLAAVGASAPATLAHPTAASVLDRVRSAVLSRPLSSIRSVRSSGTFEAIGLSAPFTEVDDLAHEGFVQRIAGDNFLTGSSGYNGRISWTRDRSGLVRIDGGESTRLQNVNQAYLQTLAYLRLDLGGATATYVGVKHVANEFDDVIDVMPPGGTPIAMWVDRATGLIVKEITTVGIVTSTTTLSDYRLVDGVGIPFDVASVDSNGNTFHTILNRADINVPGVAAELRVPRSSVHDFSIAGGTSTTVPISIINNHIYVRVMLDGNGPFTFAFDTGGQNIVTPRVAALLHVRSAGHFNLTGTGARTEGVQFTRVRAMRIGAATIRNQDFLVLPIAAGFGMSEGVMIDGMFGPAVPDRFLTTINYMRGRLTLALQGDATPSAPTAPFFFDGTIPVLETTIDGVRARTDLDTGNRGQLYLSTPFVALHPAIAAYATTGVAVTGFGVGGPSYGRLGRVPAISVGPFALHGVVAAFGTQHTGATADPFTDANLGGGAWNRFSLTLDYAHQRIFLLPNARYGNPFEYDHSGMFVIDHHGSVTVVGVTPNTPAARAGLRKGDQILTVGGRSATSYTLSQLRGLFMGEAGTRVVLRVSSGGQERTVHLTLARYV